jgi:BMFP domain-containing protein YqiC
MQTENKLFEDLSKVATAAMGTLAGMGREMSDDARRRARDFVGGADTVDREEFDAVKANAAAAREAVEVLKGEMAALSATVAALRAEIAALTVKKPRAT